jgi:hypothetical protein
VALGGLQYRHIECIQLPNSMCSSERRSAQRAPPSVARRIWNATLKCGGQVPKFLATLATQIFVSLLTSQLVSAQTGSSGDSAVAASIYDNLTWRACVGVSLPGCEVHVLRGILENGPSEVFIRFSPGTRARMRGVTSPTPRSTRCECGLQVLRTRSDLIRSQVSWGVSQRYRLGASLSL